MKQSEVSLAAPIQEMMESLRQRIRRYAWLEGLAVGVIWLCLTFWIGWVIDYLPVRMGSTEMPRAARAVLLIVISVVLLIILYRFVLRRVFARLRASNLAVVLERAFPDFADSLVTAAELDDADAESDIGRSMLQAARDEAAEKAKQVDVDQVLNYKPLYRSAAAAVLLLLSIVVYGFTARQAFGVWVNRLYGLSNDLYPRRNQIEAVGFDERQEVTVARGTDFRLRVRADATRPVPPPKVCTIFFTTEQGRRGRANMSKQGVEREGYQYYMYEGKPFRNLLGDIEFDIVGGDHRLSNYRLRVVDSPQVVGIRVHSQLPEYTGLMPRREPYFSGMKFVRGSQVTLQLSTNKPILKANIIDSVTEELFTIAFEGTTSQEFEYRVESLDSAVSLDVVLHDVDGITSPRPYRVSIGADADSPPEIGARLVAISSAVTPDAMIPVEGEAKDDFGIARLWTTLTAGNHPEREVPASIGSDNQFATTIDLRKLRRDETAPMTLDVNSKLLLSVHAEDHCNIETTGNIGTSDEYELEIVTPSQLLALLEARELGLRKRFEQIITELQESRDSVSQVEAVPMTNREPTPTAAEQDTSEQIADEMEEAVENSGTALANRKRQRALMRLRVQRAFQHSQRAAQEVLGVALSFDDIRQELVNNRIDSTDRQTRMERDISVPLKGVAEGPFPRLSDELQQLEKSLGDTDETNRMTVQCVRTMDEILSVLTLVRDKMLDLETYNELIDQLRALIREQNDLINKTKKERKKSALDLLK